MLRRSVIPLTSGLSDSQQAFLHSFRQKLDGDTEHSNAEKFFESNSVSAPRRGEAPLPPWLKLSVPKGFGHIAKYNEIRQSMRQRKLATVCESAKCPNIGECWGGEDGRSATATIMIMGNQCTRACRFCSVATSREPPPLDVGEPDSVAEAVHNMGVDYIVITMVDRDDLSDGGAAHVAKTIRAVKAATPSMLLEILAGDFRGNLDHVSTVATAGLEVYAHNVECVERITANVRDRRANYRQSLATLEHASKLHTPSGHAVITKSSIMLGLGEEPHEVRQTLKDLRSAGVSAVTLGQYLQPSRSRMAATRYAHPMEFEEWQKEAMAMGFLYCASGPMVRSSYRAGEYYLTSIIKRREAAQSTHDAPLPPAQ